ncbi:MAG: hypothetical protein F6K39_08995 [Okeania sp. SIO3B3]|nr:hypothetical protein [Okeania sp. SIO3B3]
MHNHTPKFGVGPQVLDNMLLEGVILDMFSKPLIKLEKKISQKRSQKFCLEIVLFTEAAYRGTTQSADCPVFAQPHPQIRCRTTSAR